MTDYKQTRDAAGKVEDYEKIIEELEAKLSESEALLAKAVEALSAIEGWSNNPEIEEFARNTIAELSSVSCANTTGGRDE